jgi:hypothetical protein
VLLSWLPEADHVRARARVEKGDLEVALGDRASLPDELVHLRLGDDALPGLVGVERAHSVTPDCPVLRLW